MTIRSFVLLSVLALLACIKPAHAAQSYDNCAGTIASLPAVIASQGTWCLKADLATALTTGNAIAINANNVTIDCNDFKLGGLAAGVGTQTYGIYARDRQNITVRHCNIRGFYVGVSLEGTGGANNGGGHVVEDNNFDGNTYIAVSIGGDGSVIRRNRIFDTGGSTIQLGPEAVYVAYAVDVLDNTISGVAATASGNGYAIGIFSGGNIVSGNRLSGLVSDGTGLVWGIRNNSTKLFITSNFLTGSGLTGSEGLSCFNVNNSRAKDNVISGFATGMTNCGDAGGNDVTP